MSTDVLYDRPGNPPKWVADSLGLTEAQLHDRLHKLKRAGGLRGPDRVTICRNGTVLDYANDEDIGNLCDEV